ncbi:MAG: hypothetical protein WDZ62_02475 [Candidatus Pacearchaeota archaeon]
MIDLLRILDAEDSTVKNQWNPELLERAQIIEKKIQGLSGEQVKEFYGILKDSLYDRVWCQTNKIDYCDFNHNGDIVRAKEILYENYIPLN